MSFVLMVEPLVFYGNPVTALSNSYQTLDDASRAVTTSMAIAEHRLVVRRLREEFRVPVHVLRVYDDVGDESERMLQNSAFATKPDAIFPNNSISFHVVDRQSSSKEVSDDGHGSLALRVVLYPMSEGRRDEIPPALLTALAKCETTISNVPLPVNVIDMRTLADQRSEALEGTGAINFTADGTAMFVSYSARAVPRLASHAAVHCFARADQSACRCFGFTSKDESGNAVYHTNVVGWVGDGICSWCLDAMEFASDEEQRAFCDFLQRDVCRGETRKCLAITKSQMRQFAGNCIEIRRSSLPPLLCMSSTAWAAYTEQQKTVLIEHYGNVSNIAVFDIPTIERCGGGSLRCLIACSVGHGPLAAAADHDKLFAALIAKANECGQ